MQFSLALLDATLFLYKFILSLNKILSFILKKKKVLFMSIEPLDNNDVKLIF